MSEQEVAEEQSSGQDRDKESNSNSAIARIAKGYLRDTVKLTAESFGFILQAVIVAKVFRFVFGSQLLDVPLATGGIAVVAFGIAANRNYCFLTERRYGLFN